MQYQASLKKFTMIGLALVMILSNLLIHLSTVKAIAAPAQKEEKLNALVLIQQNGYEEVLQEAAKQSAIPISLTFYASSEITVDELQQQLSTHQLMLISTHGQSTESIEPYYTAIEAFKKQGGTVLFISHSQENRFSSSPMKGHPQLFEYWAHGGKVNYKRMFNYILHHFYDYEQVVVEPVDEIPLIGIYHPKSEEIFATLEAYFEWYQNHGYDPNKPLFGMKFYKAWYVKDELRPVNAIIESLEARGANVIPVYLMDSQKRQPANIYPELNFFKEGGTEDGEVIIDALVNFIYFSGPSPHEERVKHLALLNVPLLHAATTTYLVDEWKESTEGIPQSSLHSMFVQTELRGSIDPVVVMAREKNRSGDLIYTPLPEQVDLFSNKVMNWANLQRTTAADKKIAIIYYNNPPGKHDIATASNLNVHESLVQTLKALTEQGFDTSALRIEQLEPVLRKVGRNVGSWEGEMALKELVDQGYATLLPVEVYEEWFAQLPKERQEEVIAAYGPPPGEWMVYQYQGKQYIVLPVIQIGQVLLAPQPNRSAGTEEMNQQHSRLTPPSHQYIAFYFWLKKEYKADALIHFGTHGTQELLPGKERGLSADDWPMLLVQDLPVLYPYIMDNIAEATIAKRRGSATIVTHMIPPMIAGELYGDLAELHQLYHGYQDSHELETLQQGYQDKILAKVKELGLMEDLELMGISAEPFPQFLEGLHDYLEDLAVQNVPYGLHTFGEGMESALALGMAQAMLGKTYQKKVEELLQALWQREPQRMPSASGEREHAIITAEKAVLEAHLLKELSPEIIMEQWFGQQDEELKKQLELAKEFYSMLIINQEMDTLMQGLAGHFVIPRVGGDPLRSPTILPTGHNMISVDPTTIPTPVAWEVGKKLTDQFLEQYVEEHGHYPEKVAITLWGVETMRQHGVAEAQVLYLMGLQPQWRDERGGSVTGVVPIPQEELGRPRIDVAISATGIFRDLFPNLLTLLHQGVQLASEQDEPDNYVRAGTEKLRTYLQSQGINDEERLHLLATSRIFSMESGGYGTGLDDLTIASHKWEDESDLTSVYFQNHGYLYGEEIWSEHHVDLFKEVLRGTDAAILARSSNLRGVLSTSHPFEYLGGLAIAIRELDGKSPELWITNIRDPRQAKMQKADSFFRQELRSRQFNPKWIEGQMEEGYSGASEMTEALQYFWGWQVMEPTMVSETLWEEYRDIYLEDKYELGIKQWFEEQNPYAYQVMMEHMLEAVRKGYWNANDEVSKDIADRYNKLIERVGSSGTSLAHSQVFTDHLKKYAPAPQAALVMPQPVTMKGTTEEQITKDPVAPEEKEDKIPENRVEPVEVKKEAEQRKAFSIAEKEKSNLIDSMSWFAFATLISFVLIVVFMGYRKKKREEIDVKH
ncbi:cobaltochelatase subunit CobN [Rubeoparvulum massiliense]|uniref:cobaltochelatase subunit CobN n=1 Tax=Rubeoparvulum massiliense TaxID=1631346 RepID=UPI00065E9974|nr:cobaltochelatase subunit CobN [Rubeoparvulum massiliense]